MRYVVSFHDFWSAFLLSVCTYNRSSLTLLLDCNMRTHPRLPPPTQTSLRSLGGLASVTLGGREAVVPGPDDRMVSLAPAPSPSSIFQLLSTADKVGDTKAKVESLRNTV